MADNIPDNISRKDILNAISKYDKGIDNSFGDSINYNLIYKGNKYPPKAIVGIAAETEDGRILKPKDLKGGKRTKCFRVLRNNGFTIVNKVYDWIDKEISEGVMLYFKVIEENIKPDQKNIYITKSIKKGILNEKPILEINYLFRCVSAVLKTYCLQRIEYIKPLNNIEDYLIQKILTVLIEFDILNVEDFEPTIDIALLDIRVKNILKNKVFGQPKGNRKPSQTKYSSNHYERDPLVKAWILENAQGVCEYCRNDAPFVSVSGSLYLELHHIIQLSEGGPDTIENSVALCPNCHKECHYGSNNEKVKETLYMKIERLREKH